MNWSKKVGDIIQPKAAKVAVTRLAALDPAPYRFLDTKATPTKCRFRNQPFYEGRFAAFV